MGRTRLRATSVANFKARQAAGVGLVDVGALHTRFPRPGQCPVDHLVHVTFRTLEEGFNAAVRQVPHPTGHTTRLGFTQTGVAVEDALHVTAHDDTPGDSVGGGHRLIMAHVLKIDWPSLTLASCRP